MKDREIHGESNVHLKSYNVHLKDRKGSKELMFGLNEIIEQLAMANSVCWYGHVLRREDGHVMKRALDFVVEGQSK